MITRCQPWLGTFVEVTALSDGAVAAGFAAVARVHAMMNAHDPASELSVANRTAHVVPVRLSRWTAAVVSRAQYWARLSDGAFDASGGDWRAVTLTGRTLRFSRPLRLDLSGIAKGFAVDRAVVAMRAAGATAGLVNAGGDLRGFGPDAWPIRIVGADRVPVGQVELTDAALATSAGRPDGSFAHLPGRDARLTAATVEAACAIDADALTKIVLSGSARAATCLAAAGARALTLTAGGAAGLAA